MIRRRKDGNTAARESKSELDFFPLVWREVVMKAGPEINQEPETRNQKPEAPTE